MERMADEINALIGRLNEAGSALATQNLFHRETVQIENKPRPMRDFAEIDLGPDPTAGTFVVIIHNESVLTNVITILKENGFINIDTSDRRKLKVVKPRPTIQQEEDLENQIKRLGKNSMSKVSAIKACLLYTSDAADTPYV